MKLKTLNPQGQPAGEVEIPAVFSTPVRKDLILRSNLAIASNQRQPYGADPRAGKKSSAKVSRRRRKYRGSYGIGISRVPRKIVSRNGTRMNWIGAFAPGTVGGRRAHPPVADKNWKQKINEKERKTALKSAIAATLQKNYTISRGHNTPTAYPFIITNDFENITKTKDARKALENIGLKEELERCSQRTIRAGHGKSRGRPYTHKKGPLLVVSNPTCKLITSAKNIAGIDIITANRLNTQLLAPGHHPGRLTLYTESSLQHLKKLTP